MSEPNFVPFESTTTPVIDRANRLISLKTHPGFLDVLRISQELAKTANDILVNYPGWDPQQVMVLKVRAQAAKEHHELLISKIQEAIHDGIVESSSAFPAREEKSPEAMLEQGDFVRQKVLEKFENLDLRPAGSY